MSDDKQIDSGSGLEAKPTSAAKIMPFTPVSPGNQATMQTIESRKHDSVTLPQIGPGRNMQVTQEFGTIGPVSEVEMGALGDGEKKGLGAIAIIGTRANTLAAAVLEGIDDDNEDTEKEEEKQIPDEENPERHLVWGEYYSHSETSLFIFGPQNMIRRFALHIYHHKQFDNFILFLIIFNSILLGIYNYNDPENLTGLNQFIQGSEIYFVVLFAAECVIKIIAMGFFFGPDEGTYIKQTWNQLDFIVVVSSFLTEIPQLKSISGMRTLRLLRPLRSLSNMPSMKSLIETLLGSVSQLGGVMVLAIFFFLIFAILGVSLWSGTIYQRCYFTEKPVAGEWFVDPTDASICSAERPCAENRYCGSLAVASRDPDSGLASDIDITADSTIEDLNFGFTNFNNLGTAFLTIFQCITLEGWIDVTNMYQDAYQSSFVVVYFLLCVIVCSMFVLNLTIAVMLLKYDELNEENDESEQILELREMGEEIGLPFKFIDFIIETDNIGISNKGLKMLAKSEAKESFWETLLSSDQKPDDEHWYYKPKLTRWAFYLATAPLFNGFITFVIVLNTITLAMNKYPDWDEGTKDILKGFNLFFTIIFTFEVVVKVLGLGVRDYGADKMNLFDAAIVTIGLVELGINTAAGSDEGGGPFSALRAFRLFRIFKIFKSGELRMLLESMILTVADIKDYCILLLLFIYIWSLMGMSFFAGKVKFDDDGKLDLENGTVPRLNFDSILDALLIVFCVIIGENWNSVMYNHMLATGYGASIFFILLVISGTIIMLNLFLAILLGNFDRARTAGGKKKIFEAFSSFDKQGYDVVDTISLLFDDVEFCQYINEKIMTVRDERDLEREKRLREKAIAEGKLTDRGEEEDKPQSDKEPSQEFSGDDHGRISEDEDDENFSHTELEIARVFIASTNGTLEMILTGEQPLEEGLNNIDLSKVQMTSLQREKTIEILTYVKRQQRRRKKAMEYDLKVKEHVTELKQQIAAEENEFDGSQISNTEVVEEQDATMMSAVIQHLLTSSLFLFPQDSPIRNYCQMCLQTDEEEEGGGNEEENKQETEAGLDQSMASPSKANKVSSLELEDIAKPSPAKSAAIKKPRSLSVVNIEPLDKKLAASTKVKKSVFGAEKKEKKVNVVAKIFDSVIMTLIIISSITLVIGGPVQDPNDPVIVFLSYLDNCFTVLFTIEMLIKVIALGFFTTNEKMSKKGFTAYIVNPWNILDFIVVLASLFDFVVTIQMALAAGGDSDSSSLQGSLQSLKALRALRALRPLRMISRDPGMKLIVNALLQSIPAMGNVSVVCLLFVLIFAIMGVDFFKGKFYHCSLEDFEGKDMNDCIAAGGEWQNYNENFDNVFNAMQVLIEMMTTEGWLDVMFNGVDAVDPVDGVPQQPIKNNNMVVIIFFVLYMVVGSQFILNLFVGVVMDNFNKLKEASEMGGCFVTDEQRDWMDANKLGMQAALTKKIQSPEGWRAKVYWLVTHSYFDGLITFFIGMNTVAMAIKFDGMDEGFEKFLGDLNIFFAVVFNAEMILKLIALQLQYFDSAWNQFDCFVVIATDAGFVMAALNMGANFSTVATVIRALRIMRIIRLIRSQEDIKIILDTLQIILPQIRNFMTLMFLLLFIYAALGINQFGGVVEGEFLTDKNNFQDVGTAIVYLFRCSTGEDWNKVMWELAQIDDGTGRCIDDQDFEIFTRNENVFRGCGNDFSFIYFFTFLVVLAWLIINLAVSAVIDGLETSAKQNSGTFEGDHVQELIETWQNYDPRATGWIHIRDFLRLLIELPPPFGNNELSNKFQFSEERFKLEMNKVFSRRSYFIDEERGIIMKNKDVIKVLSSYKIPTYKKRYCKVHFKDVFWNLVKRKFREDIDDFKISGVIKDKLKNDWNTSHRQMAHAEKTGLKAHQAYATLLIEEYAIRRFKNNESIKDRIDPKQYAKYAYIGKDDSIEYSREAMLKKDFSASDSIKLIDEYGRVVGGFRKDIEDDRKAKRAQARAARQGPNLNSEHGQNQTGTRRPRNSDENPQEFMDEDEGPEVPQQVAQNQPTFNHPVAPRGQAARLPPINQARNQQVERDDVGSMGRDDQLQFNVKMGQSITDSNAQKSEAELLPHESPDQIEEPQMDERVFRNDSLGTQKDKFATHDGPFMGQKAVKDAGPTTISPRGNFGEPPKTATAGATRAKTKKMPDKNFSEEGLGQKSEKKNNFFQK